MLAETSNPAATEDLPGGRATSRLSAHALHLQRVETPVESVVGEQLVVTASLGDLPLVDHDDAVGVAHGGQTVGDDEHGAAAHEIGESLLHHELALGVEVA